jgi:hypothetical protein
MARKSTVAAHPTRLPDANTQLLEAVTRGGERWAKTALRSEASAKAALVKMGIVTQGGKLTAKYK